LAFILITGCQKGKFVEKVDNLIKQGKFKEAEQLLIERDTTRAVFHLLMGDILRREDKLVRALSEYQLASRQIPGGFKERLTRGLILLGRRSQRKGYIYIAEKAYKITLEIDPTYPLGDGFLLLGNLAFREEKYDTAYHFYKKYLSMGGNKKLVLVPYVISLFKEGHYDEILKLMPLGPRLPSADLIFVYDNTLYRKAKMKMEEGDLDSVLILLSKVTKNPSPGVALEDSISYLLGEVYEMKGDTLRALYEYNKIAESPRYTQLREKAIEKIRTLTLR